MNNQTTNTFKIYRDGKYDLKANLAIKINHSLPHIVDAVDSFFTKH